MKNFRLVYRWLFIIGGFGLLSEAIIILLSNLIYGEITRNDLFDNWLIISLTIIILAYIIYLVEVLMLNKNEIKDWLIGK